MAKSKTDVRRAQQKADAAAGIVRDTRNLAKMERNANQISCVLCKATFKVTERMFETHTHAESKHPKLTYEDCFPVEEEE